MPPPQNTLLKAATTALSFVREGLIFLKTVMAERSLLTTEDPGSYPGISNSYLTVTFCWPRKRKSDCEWDNFQKSKKVSYSLC